MRPIGPRGRVPRDGRGPDGLLPSPPREWHVAAGHIRETSMEKKRSHVEDRSTSWAVLFGLVVVVAPAPGANVGSGGVPVHE